MESLSPSTMSSLFKPPHLRLFWGELNSSLKHYVTVNEQSHVDDTVEKCSISLPWCGLRYKNKEPEWWGQWAGRHADANAKSTSTEHAAFPHNYKLSSLLLCQPAQVIAFLNEMQTELQRLLLHGIIHSCQEVGGLVLLLMRHLTPCRIISFRWQLGTLLANKK